MAGRFIAVEGGEGAGKTTQLPFIAAYLERAGYSVVLTREPGGTALGEEIRALVLQNRQTGMTAAAEALLMFAARAEHIEQVIRPALVIEAASVAASAPMVEAVRPPGPPVPVDVTATR